MNFTKIYENTYGRFLRTNLATRGRVKTLPLVARSMSKHILYGVYVKYKYVVAKKSTDGQNIENCRKGPMIMKNRHR